MFLLLGLVLLLVLPSSWNLVAFGICLVLFLGELAFWNRTVRRNRVAAGAETLIGRTGTVVSDCRPDGQVRLDGEIWHARCTNGADRGDAIVVTGREGLMLLVTTSTPVP